MTIKVVVLTGGVGSGKSTFAPLLDSQRPVMALADRLREDLSKKYPTVDWFNKTQEYKRAPQEVLGGKSPRDMLIAYGSETEAAHPGWLGWKIADRIKNCEWSADKWTETTGDNFTVVIDDARRLTEYQELQDRCIDNGWNFLHIHIDGGVPDFDCEALREKAHYTIARRT